MNQDKQTEDTGPRSRDAAVRAGEEELAVRLERSAQESRGEVEFKQVRITGDALSMQVHVRWNNR